MRVVLKTESKFKEYLRGIYAPKTKFSSNIHVSNMRDCVSSGYPDTEKRVENMRRSRVFLTKFKVFG